MHAYLSCMHNLDPGSRTKISNMVVGRRIVLLLQDVGSRSALPFIGIDGITLLCPRSLCSARDVLAACDSVVALYVFCIKRANKGFS